jgi:transposase
MRQLEVRLKPWESRRLRELRDAAPSGRVVKRAMCLLMSAAGEAATHIARVTGLSPRAVTSIRRRWRARRLRSLVDRGRAGRPSRVTPGYRRALRRALRKGPLACGFVFTVWSIARLATYLRRRTGIAIGVDWLRRLAHAEGFVVARPAHTLAGKRDEREYRKARRRLERLKKGRPRWTRPTNSGTPTPRSSTCCRTWCVAGRPRDGSAR